MNPAPVEKRLLSNGLKLITRPSRANDLVAVMAMLGIGSICETDEQAGLSNLTQALLLKGTDSRTAERIAVEMESTGARISASASRDHGVVSMMVTSDGLRESLPVFFDVLCNPSFPPDEVSHEIAQALQKIKAKEDQLLVKTTELLAEAYYATHPYHKSLLGYPETVSRLTGDAIRSFFNTYYRPNNTVLAAVGNFDPVWLVDQVEAHLERVAPASLPPPNGHEVPPLTESRQRIHRREAQAAWLALGYGAPRVTDRDYPAMEVLDAIMGGSMNCRLFTELRDKRGLAYQVGSTYVARPGPSMFVAYIGTAPNQFEVARDAILDEVKKIRSAPVTSEELHTSKTYLKGTFIMGQERNSSQAALLARYEAMGLGWDYIQRYPGLIDGVAVEDVLRAAQSYLGEAYALGAVIPKDAPAVPENGPGISGA